MLFGNAELFAYARDSKLRKIELPHYLEKLRQEICSKYLVSVVTIIFDQVELGPGKGTPRLNVILETDADEKAWKLNAVEFRPGIKEWVLARFIEIAKSAAASLVTDQVFLVTDNFADECLNKAGLKFLEHDAARITNRWASVPVWKIDGFFRELVVFLETDKDLRRRTADGTCEKIRIECFNAMKKFDEFGYLTPETFRLNFDTHKNFNKCGSFGYWR